MVNDDNAPATKKDLRLLKSEISSKIDGFDSRMDRLDKKMDQFKDEILRHFDLTAENIRHDLAGANRDEIEMVKDRVTRLERHTGLVAA